MYVCCKDYTGIIANYYMQVVQHEAFIIMHVVTVAICMYIAT